jgi:hypothetical protein
VCCVYVLSPKKTGHTSGEVRTHALKEDQNLSLAP